MYSLALGTRRWGCGMGDVAARVPDPRWAPVKRDCVACGCVEQQHERNNRDIHFS